MLHTWSELQKLPSLLRVEESNETDLLCLQVCGFSWVRSRKPQTLQKRESVFAVSQQAGGLVQPDVTRISHRTAMMTVGVSLKSAN